MPPANEPHCMFVTMLTRCLVVLIVFCEARSRIVRLASRSYRRSSLAVCSLIGFKQLPALPSKMGALITFNHSLEKINFCTVQIFVTPCSHIFNGEESAFLCFEVCVWTPHTDSACILSQREAMCIHTSS